MAQQVYCCDYKTNQRIKIKNSLKMMIIKITEKQFSFFSKKILHKLCNFFNILSHLHVYQSNTCMSEIIWNAFYHKYSIHPTNEFSMYMHLILYLFNTLFHLLWKYVWVKPLEKIYLYKKYSLVDLYVLLKTFHYLISIYIITLFIYRHKFILNLLVTFSNLVD